MDIAVVLVGPDGLRFEVQQFRAFYPYIASLPEGARRARGGVSTATDFVIDFSRLVVGGFLGRKTLEPVLFFVFIVIFNNPFAGLLVLSHARACHQSAP